MKLQAKWIWKRQRDPKPYNQTIIATKQFKLPVFTQATIAITADSWYRLFINGEWVNDGPCRSWPEHYQYDELDVSSYLRPGDNEIQVIARFFGVGTFHQVPVQGGLLAQLEVTEPAKKKTVIVTDQTWQVSEVKAWNPNTPKVSIQMEPFEHYDARLDGKLRWSSADEVCGAADGPWGDLHARDCALLTRQPFALKRFVEANVVQGDWMCFAFPVLRLLYPGLIEANHAICGASVMATNVRASKAMKIRIQDHGLTVTVNGKRAARGTFTLRKGDNFLVAAVTSFRGHPFREPWIRFVDTEGFRLANPKEKGHDNPWCFAPLPGAQYARTDIENALMDRPERDAIDRDIRDRLRKVLKEAKDVATLEGSLGTPLKVLPAEKLWTEEVHKQFVHREVLENAAYLVESPGALMHDNGAWTVVRPSKDGDVELIYDLGEQNCGYWQFELLAREGVIVDVFAVEYITPDGRIQHTGDNRNGLRYICSEGLNQFVSLKRRSGRFLFVTIRNAKQRVRIRHVGLIESTYPVEEVGSFACSDRRLGEIWRISQRTLKLCMEDTFTDCPLYEQTLWVGDARNEAIFAFTAFGAADLARRCIELAAQSLERYPITGCQVPSCWDTLLPAWSFLWGISVWDYYFYSGDEAFLRRMWPWVMRNLKGAAELVDGRGLFSAPFWNMFDWSGIDDGHATVVHNSMFAIGAADAALECAAVLGDEKAAAWLRDYRAKLAGAVNALWDDTRGGYPDSVHADGSMSPSMCQHTSFLSLLYDIVPDSKRERAADNVLNPGDDLVRIGSPFAIMYLYEALEKMGCEDGIVQSIYDSYLPMLEADATTVWESFPSGTTGSGGFPTRSHTHAWSSAPIHFLNRIILGIRQTGVGGTSYAISPRVSELEWARGTNAGAKGPVNVSWRIEGEVLHVNAGAPEGVDLCFKRNETHNLLGVVFNGRKV